MRAFSPLLVALAGFTAVAVGYPKSTGSGWPPSTGTGWPPSTDTGCPPSTGTGLPPLTKRSLTTPDPWPSSSNPFDGHPLPTTSSRSSHWVADRSIPTPPPFSGEPPEELFGHFLDVPHTSHPRNITAPKGGCQEANEGKGVPKDANFIEVFMEHWCEFYTVSNHCDTKTDPSQRERFVGPITNVDISKYKGRDFKCDTYKGVS
ncbi:hypothetical protein SLS60_007276 [Paraconiothyrium brasiliense]|uniref:Uncharacterized protein n=1 Tax=Paraconiothyrium brasiliense TaxID=300254 RepID=A0ABR3R5I6_9PLEO